jgi:hypothetical protein
MKGKLLLRSARRPEKISKKIPQLETILHFLTNGKILSYLLLTISYFRDLFF